MVALTRVVVFGFLAMALDQRPTPPRAPPPAGSGAYVRQSIRAAAVAMRRAEVACIMYADAVSYGAPEDQATLTACAALQATGEIPDDVDHGAQPPPKEMREWEM